MHRTFLDDVENAPDDKDDDDSFDEVNLINAKCEDVG